MIGQSSRHRWRARLPSASSVVDLDAQRFDRASQVVCLIFPGTGGFEHLPFFGKGQGLVHQPSVHLPGRQVRALDIGGMLAQELPYFFQVAVDHLDRDPCQAAPGTMLDHMEVAPIGLGLPARRGGGGDLDPRIQAPAPKSRPLLAMAGGASG